MRNQSKAWAVVKLGELPPRNIEERRADRGRIVRKPAGFDMAVVTTGGGIGAAPGECDSCG